VFQADLTTLLEGSDRFELLAGQMMWEVRPRGADKGRAVTVLMERAPFAGRLPLFIGDDVTDEDGMRVALALGGDGLRVDDAFGDPSGVRAWLRDAAAAGRWPPLPGAS
jgi:trehalose 6-phosphate phosphatase